MAALVGVLFAVVCMGASLCGGYAILAALDVDVALTGADVLAPLVFGTIAATVFGAMLGVTVGTLIRNQVGAILAVVAYAFLVDAVLFAAVPSAGRFLPARPAMRFSGQPTEHLLAPGTGAAVLVAWTVVLTALATARTDHTDI